MYIFGLSYRPEVQVVQNEISAPRDVIRNLYVYPTYAVLIPPPHRGAKSKTAARVRNESNLKQNQSNGVLSPKARKRLVNAINWLLLVSKKKRVYCRDSGKWVSFRISFVTLTIPAVGHDISDHVIKRKVLHNFLSACYAQYGMRHYVWKAERNKNGNIHFHLTTDSYIHHSAIRRLWNQSLEKVGLISLYQEKMSSLSFDEYRVLRSREEGIDEQQIKNAFMRGVSEGWSNPNSTDVHAVRGIRNLGAYLADYMAKKEDGKEPIKGRIWAASESLSTTVKNETEVIVSHDPHIENDLYAPGVKVRGLKAVDKTGKESGTIGKLFLWSLEQIGKDFKGGLLDIISDVVARVRSPLPELGYNSV